MKLLNWIKCKLWFHDYFFIKNLSADAQKIGCRRCGRTFGINYSVRCVLPWDDELESFYDERRWRNESDQT